MVIFIYYEQFVLCVVLAYNTCDQIIHTTLDIEIRDIDKIECVSKHNL